MTDRGGVDRGGRPRPLVDYEGNASRYKQGRDLAPALLDNWTAAVAARLPAGHLRLVVDGGAGTGAFLGMWQTLGADRILAVEPSSAMRALAADRHVANASIVAGELASLPVPECSADVVWVSAVLHHVPDRRAALAEINRILRPGGRLLLRGFVPGLSHIPWLDSFPGAERARKRFPSLHTILNDAEALEVVDATVVHDPEGVLPSQAAAWVSAMRTADSLLTALTDQEIEAGISRLRRLPDHPFEPMALGLLTFQRPHAASSSTGLQPGALADRAAHPRDTAAATSRSSGCRATPPPPSAADSSRFSSSPPSSCTSDHILQLRADPLPVRPSRATREPTGLKPQLPAGGGLGFGLRNLVSSCTSTEWSLR